MGAAGKGVGYQGCGHGDAGVLIHHDTRLGHRAGEQGREAGVHSRKRDAGTVVCGTGGASATCQLSLQRRAVRPGLSAAQCSPNVMATAAIGCTERHGMAWMPRPWTPT